MTAGCPPESNPYPYPYPYPDSNPKFESGSVTNPYPIQAPGACAEERPRAGEQSLRHSLRCDTVPQFSMGASLRSQSSLEILLASLGSSAAIAATGCAASFALIGLTSRCFVPQFAIVALLRYRLQVSFAHWTSASPVSATGGGEAPSPLGLLRAVSRTARALRASPL